MSGRRGALWGVAALVVVGVALAIGLATASDETSPSAPAAEAPGSIDLPALGKTASLPDLKRQAPAQPVESEESEESVEEFAPTEESSGGGGGSSSGGEGGSGETIVPEG